MRIITGTDWGASKKTLLTMYKALIRSLLDYGSIALDFAAEMNKKKFDTVQYKALRICCSAMTGTSLAALQVECAEMPLETRCKRQMLHYLVKIKTMKNHRSKSILEDSWCNHYGNYSENREPFAVKVADFFNKNEFDFETSEPQTIPPWKNAVVTVICNKNW
jgi:hypothetical protein